MLQGGPQKDGCPAGADAQSSVLTGTFSVGTGAEITWLYQEKGSGVRREKGWKVKGKGDVDYLSQVPACHSASWVKGKGDAQCRTSRFTNDNAHCEAEHRSRNEEQEHKLSCDNTGKIQAFVFFLLTNVCGTFCGVRSSRSLLWLDSFWLLWLGSTARAQL